MQNWLPPFWALIGTAIAVLKIGVLSYWTESHYGGTGAAIGGTLLIGSLPGLIRRPSFRSGVPGAIGVALLANSRPFEGLLLTVLCLGYAGWQIIRQSSASTLWISALSRSIAGPLLIVMLPVGAWMAFYNLRVTGSALVMPYLAHERQYAAASAFPWVKPGVLPPYRHEVLRQFWDWDMKRKTLQRDNFLLTRLPSFASIGRFYLGIALFVPILVCAPGIVKSRRTRLAFWLAILFLAGLALEVEFIPHYAAPVAVLFYIVAAGALRTLRYWRPRRLWIAQVCYGIALTGIAVQSTAALFQPEHRFLYDRRGFQAERARILEFLDRLPGKQLVIVRYGPNHDVHQEWVYNRADIDDSAIVWARSMGREKDLVLLSYFKDRRVWLLDENGQALISSYRAPITN
jgi:hypothetical protein